ncbi:MAG: hypothetical protein MJY55_04690 [Bacteroidales bacterium]|nr:hypothetical protein [Bacteroidales bacterium]
MNKTVYKILTLAVLPIVIIVLTVLIVNSVMKPIKFENEKAKREAVAIQRLKDIRTLQTAFKSEAGHYASTFDSLKMFYRGGSITVDMQIGSNDDSVAVENTKALRKKNPKITAAELLQLSRSGERLVFVIKSKVPVKDTLFNNRPDFCIDSIFVIPFSGEAIGMQTNVKQVSGVPVPLFEATIPYKSLLCGMDNQLRINLDADRKDTGRYPGLMVGSISAPNNNAGNWE